MPEFIQVLRVIRDVYFPEIVDIAKHIKQLEIEIIARKQEIEKIKQDAQKKKDEMGDLVVAGVKEVLPDTQNITGTPVVTLNNGAFSFEIPTGARGERGYGTRVKGQAHLSEIFKKTSKIGDIWIDENSVNGDGYISQRGEVTQDNWAKVGKFKGVKGDKGDMGLYDQNGKTTSRVMNANGYFIRGRKHYPYTVTTQTGIVAPNWRAGRQTIVTVTNNVLKAKRNNIGLVVLNTVAELWREEGTREYTAEFEIMYNKNSVVGLNVRIEQLVGENKRKTLKYHSEPNSAKTKGSFEKIKVNFISEGNMEENRIRMQIEVDTIGMPADFEIRKVKIYPGKNIDYILSMKDNEEKEKMEKSYSYKTSTGTTQVGMYYIVAFVPETTKRSIKVKEQREEGKTVTTPKEVTITSENTIEIIGKTSAAGKKIEVDIEIEEIV